MMGWWLDQNCIYLREEVLILYINICGGKWLFASIWNGYLLSYLRGVVNREGIQFLPGILRKQDGVVLAGV